MNTKSKKKVSNIMLAIIICLVVFYTIGAFVVEIVWGHEVSPTLTGAYFSFCGVELASLTAIKTSKVKHNKDNAEEIAFEELPPEEIIINEEK